MITNKQLSDILNKGDISLTDDEINEVRVLMIQLANIEYAIYIEKKWNLNAAVIHSDNQISPLDNLPNAA